MLIAIGGVAIILVFLYIFFLADTAPDVMPVKQQMISFSSVQFDWPESGGAEYYQISRKKLDAAAFQLMTKSTMAAFEDTSLSPGEDYLYQITAHKEDGSIIATGDLSIKTPAIEFGLSADEVNDKRISLVWNKLENMQNYILYRQDLDSDKPEELKEIYRGDKVVYEDKKLRPDHNYAYLLKVEFTDQSIYEAPLLELRTGVKTKAALTFGELRVNSTPEGAKVFMNGQELGNTPFKRKGLRTGSYNISLKKEGYSDYSHRVRIRANKITSVSPELVSLTGELAILVKPFGSILIDGELLKKDTPTKFTSKVQAGDHKVTIVHAGLGARWEKKINISGGKTHNIMVDFTRMVTLKVLSTPPGKIIVDGKSTGQDTPKEITVRVGQHIIGVRLEGFEMIGGSQNINFEEDLKEPLKFVLRKKK